MIGVEGRVRSVAVHGECLLGALRRKREDGTKINVDVDSAELGMEVMIIIFVVLELNNSPRIRSSSCCLKRQWRWVKKVGVELIGRGAIGLRSGLVG